MSTRASLRQHTRRALLRGVGTVARLAVRRSARSPQRILVIKPDHLGDVVLLTPALRLLRQHCPEAQISLLIGPWSRAAVAHNPDIDALLMCEFPGFIRRAKRNLIQPYLVLLKFALLLRRQQFDVALIARDDHWWGALLATLAGIPQRIGFALPETTPFLTTALPHSFADHVTQQSVALVRALTPRDPAATPPLTPPFGAEDQAWADHWLAAHHLAPSAPLVAIHPGAGGQAKLWVAERWITVADILHQGGAHVLLTGGPAERELVGTIAQGMIAPPLLLNDGATLGQLAALYARCTLVLGVDSGPLHLATAAGARTIALFGPGDHRRFGPWGDPQHQIVLRSGLWCSPCGVLEACPRGTAPSECMTLITPAEVLAAVAKQLACTAAHDGSQPAAALQQITR